MNSIHAPAYAQTFELPSPPPVIIPLPAYDTRVEDIHETFNRNAEVDFESNGFPKLGFLQGATYGDLVKPAGIREWQYEQRRSAQEILPFLYLGPLSAAKDVQFLRNENITLVMAIRDLKSVQGKFLTPRAAIEMGIEFQTVDVSGNQELIAAFPRAVATINKHLEERSNHIFTSPSQPNCIPGRILLFCESGNERSAAVAAAYVMAILSLDLITSIQVVQNQRFCATFNDSTKILLQSYEGILQAKRQVYRSGAMTQRGREEQSIFQSGSLRPNGSGGIRASSKRPLEEDTVDTDMDGGLDYERFVDRRGSAPFIDRPMA
ncbi:MAG: hypothetical protein MMC33_001714 [Icmadophila ericetorum]|nr:hypothetical protein [Icmadophila ericetorum]